VTRTLRGAPRRKVFRVYFLAHSGGLGRSVVLARMLRHTKAAFSLFEEMKSFWKVWSAGFMSTLMAGMGREGASVFDRSKSRQSVLNCGFTLA